MEIKKLSKRVKQEISIGALVLVISTGAYLLGWTNLLTVREISVIGSPNTTITNQILNLAGVTKGEKLARIEPRSITTKLESTGFNWIKSIKISRNWISRSVNIELTTRNPVARLNGTSEYLDSEGIRFSLPPEFTASKGKNELVSKLVSISASTPINQKAAVAFFSTLPSDFKAELSGLSASSSANFQVSIKSSSSRGKELRINWGSASDTALKVKIYKALIALPENSKITTMDLSDPNSPTVK